MPHSVHLNLLLWIFICTYRPLWDEKRFSHWVHEYKFSPVCLFLWSFKYPFVVNRLSHSVHWYSLGLSSCGCSVISLLSSSVLILNDLSPAQYAQHYPLDSLTARHCAMSPSTVTKFCNICQQLDNWLTRWLYREPRTSRAPKGQGHDPTTLRAYTIGPISKTAGEWDSDPNYYQ